MLDFGVAVLGLVKVAPTAAVEGLITQKSDAAVNMTNNFRDIFNNLDDPDAAGRAFARAMDNMSALINPTDPRPIAALFAAGFEAAAKSLITFRGLIGGDAMHESDLAYSSRSINRSNPEKPHSAVDCPAARRDLSIPALVEEPQSTGAHVMARRKGTGGRPAPDPATLKPADRQGDAWLLRLAERMRSDQRAAGRYVRACRHRTAIVGVAEGEGKRSSTCLVRRSSTA